MTAADQRLTALLDRWLDSLDRHLRYAELSDAEYWQASAWPAHDRPTPWILKLARDKVLDLKARLATRQSAGDEDFADSLELMGFLSTLVGLQNIKRFIPLVDKEAPVTTPAAAPASTSAKGDAEIEITREMPQLKATGARKKSARGDGPAAVAESTKAGVATVDLIVADAVRLLKWGRHWHELAESIERIADRPAIGEIRRILRERKADIEKQAG